MKVTVSSHPSLTLVADTAKPVVPKKIDKKGELTLDSSIELQGGVPLVDASDTPLPSSIDVGALSHYAASALQQPHVLNDAAPASSGGAAASVATEGISPLVWVGGALLVGGGVALAAGGGGGGSSTSSTPTQTDTTAPVFSSATTASIAENTATTTTAYKATADNDNGVTYSLSGTDATLFNINSTTGAVTFKTSPNYEAPSDNGANNTYDFTVTATDVAGNHTAQAVALSVTNVVEPTDNLSLGSYGNLIAMTSVNGKSYYAWDLNGDGKISAAQNVNGKYDSTGAIVNASGSGYQYDLVSHDVLDTLFGGNTTNTANTVTLNGIQVALPTTGTGNTSETSDYFLSDNGTYTDMAKIWDTNNSGANTSGYPSGWTAANPYWTATPSTAGHAAISLDNGLIANIADGSYAYVALQVI